jgi:hypothetical protein
MITTLLILAATAAAEPTAAGEVERRDRELNALIATHAVRRAERFYADAFLLTTASGKSKRKPDLLAEIGSDALVLDVNETHDVVVRVLDRTAVLTGVLHQRGSYGGKAFDVELRVTDTWVFASGEWQLLAGHASAMPLRT